MKIQTTLITGILVQALSADINFDYEFKSILDAFGANASTGTLWAMVVDDNDNIFAGFGLDNSLYNQASGTADSYFTANTTQIGLSSNIGGGRVFAMGGLSGSGRAAGLTGTLTVGTTAQVQVGQEYALYWFPGVTYTTSGTYTVASQVGGLHSSSLGSGNFLETSMIIPADGFLYTTGAFSLSSGDDIIPNNNFRALTLVPEPSNLILGAFGLFGLLSRRKR